MTIQLSHEEGVVYRQTLFAKAKRVVVKVGSAILTDEKGMNQAVVQSLVEDLAFLHNSGREVILVSSGAVAAGRKKLLLDQQFELGIKEKQALAAIGQSVLMHTYDEAFAVHGQKIAQVLLTHADLAHRHRYLNIRNTLLTLLRFGVIPIINENDTVSVEELRFGDNDTLAALVTNLIEADLFICLTDVAGLYNGNPHTDPDSRPIFTITEVSPAIEAMVDEAKSALGTGGMHSKIRAAKMVAARGGSSFIGPGRQPNILQKLFAGAMIGTFFLPAKSKLPSRKHWIAYVLKPKGHLVLDDGACQAICRKGKSLLPSGILAVHGKFGPGDAVRCLDRQLKPVAVGLINYATADIELIKGVQTDQIEQMLGFKDSDEVMHRDNLVLL